LKLLEWEVFMTSERNAVPLGPGALQGNSSFAVSVALLLLRLALGWTFIYHGSQLCFGAFDGPGIAGFARGLQGMPGILSPTGWAYLAAYSEFLGGVFVFLGLLGRLGSLAIMGTMVVAIVKVHAPNGFALIHFDPVTHKMATDAASGMPLMGYEYCFNLIAMCAVVLLAGPGLISVDAVLFKRGLWARGPQPLDQPGRRG
jgi:putative oxidoreductase